LIVLGGKLFAALGQAEGVTEPVW